MTLATPLWLAAAASVIVPILIHLFGRPRPRLRRFPSLMLLRRAQSERRSTTRVRRIVSLILRCLALVLLAVMLAGPLSQWPPIARFGDRLGASAIILDTSPSMAATLGDTRRIDEARDAGRALLKALPPGEEILFLPSGDAPQKASAGDAARALMSAPVDDKRARLGADIARILDGDSPIARVFVLTDLQATSLGAPPSATQPSAQIFVLDCGADLDGNSALTGLRSEQPVHLRGRGIELRAEARSWGIAEGRVPLTVGSGGESVAVGVDLLPGALSSATVEVTPSSAGLFTCAAALPEDRLLADNTRIFATNARERLRVAVIGDDGVTRFIRAALDPFARGDSRSTIEIADSRALDGDAALDAAIVAAESLSDAETAALHALARRGTGVLFFAGAPRKALDALGFAGVTIGEAVRREQPVALAEMAITRPPLAAFAEPGAGDLSAARFTTVPRVQVAQDSGATILARYDDGTPALLESAVGRGRALLLATSPDDAWGDLVRMPEFVPLMHRLATWLAAGTAPTILAGAPGEGTIGVVPADAEQLTVLGPDGGETPLRVAGGHWRFTPRAVGAHRLRARQEDIAAFAVNLDSAESDPERLTAAGVRERLHPLDAEVIDADRLAGFMQRLGPGPADVSSLAALLALLILAVESVQSLRPRGSSEND